MSDVAEDLARARAVGSIAAQGPMPLPPELLPVESFPLIALPSAFAPWVADVSERMQCPPDFVAVPMLVAAASLVARRVGISPQGWTDWHERGNLWGMIVGRPGLMKSPAMAQALAPIHRMDARAAAEYAERAAQHEVQKKTAKLRSEALANAARAQLKKNPNADVADLLDSDDCETGPVFRRFVVNDPTYEKLGEILAANPEGVLCVRDELRALLLSLTREENAQARGFFVQAWSGGRYTFDRIGRGTITVEDAMLSIIGGIQPGPLCDLVRQSRGGVSNDGMIERFLIAWPDEGGEWRDVDRPPNAAAKRAAFEAFDTLDSLKADQFSAGRNATAISAENERPFLRFSEEALEAFRDWRVDLERRLRTSDTEGLEGALSKFRHHVPALALTIHVVDGERGPVGVQATHRALALSEYFESHARRLYGSGHRNCLRAARLILSKARSPALPDAFTARDVYRHQWSGLRDRTEVAEALELLTAHRWLIETVVDTGGRPTSVYSLVSEACHG